MRITGVLVLLLLLTGLAACGGGDSRIARGTVTLEPQPLEAVYAGHDLQELARIPGLPQDPQFNINKLTALAQHTLDASDFHLKAGNAAANATQLEMDATAGLSWALYRFGGVPREKIDAVSFSGTSLGPGTMLYLGIADYTRGRWSYMPAPVMTDNAQWDLGASAAGQFVSPGGSSYVLLICDTGGSFTLDDVTLSYANRFEVTGRVVDVLGNGIAGATVTAFAGGATSVTSPSGHYNLTLPDGSWPLAAFKDGYTFYDQPAIVTVAGANLTAPDTLGDAHGSNYEDPDPLGPDSSNAAPVLWDAAAGPLAGSFSRIDDDEDNYEFEVTTPGTYLVRLDASAATCFFPVLELQNVDGGLIDFSAQVLRGNCYVGLYVHEVPVRFQANVAGRGGGRYTLSLEPGPFAAIGGEILDGIAPLNDAIVRVEIAGGQRSDYLQPSRSFADRYRPAVADTSVRPICPGYSFAPSTQTVDLSAGPQIGVNFAATSGGFADSFEPNDTLVTAHDLGALPYLAAPPLALSPVDTADFYTFDAPAAGKALRLRTYTQQHGEDHGVTSLLLYSVLGGLAAFPEAAVNGEEVRYSGTDGGEYAVEVTLDSDRALAYALSIEEYDPVSLVCALQLNGQPVPEGRFVIHNADFTRSWIRATDDLGLTSSFPAMPGEVLYVECFAPGLDVHRTTRRVVAQAAMGNVLFNALDDPGDSLEPNSAAYFIGPALNLPIGFDASVGSSELGDGSDYYLLNAPTTQPIRIAATLPSGGELYLALFTSLGGFAGDAELRDGDVVYFPSEGVPGQQLSIYGLGGVIPYSLDIAQGDAFFIDGAVTDDLAQPVPFYSVYNATTREAYYDLGGATYMSELPLAPGSYELYVFAPNYGVLGPHVVNIVDADVTFDISGLVYSNTEPGEPNDSLATANPLTFGVPLSGRVLGDLIGFDPADFYKLNAAAGDKVRVLITVAHPWESIDAPVKETLSGEGMGKVYPVGPGEYLLDFIAPAAGEYNVEVTGTATSYSIEAQLYP